MSETKNWYEKNYKLLLVLPALLLLVSLVYLNNFSTTHGDIILKDVSLTGGTTITVLDPNTNIIDLEIFLKDKFEEVSIRAISDIQTGTQRGFFLETTSDVEPIKQELETYLRYQLNSQNSSIEFSGSSLSEGFYKQLRISIFVAFIFMALVVFLIFKTPIPSLAVIISAFADIVMTVAVIDFFGFKLSTAGIISILMLIGYSVDTDILLTTRLLLNKEESLNKRMIGAFKTGMTMTLTSIAAITVSLIIIYNLTETLRQMFTILLIGLSFDIFNTWITNASILRWYVEAKDK